MISPDKEFIKFTSISNMKENKKAWGFPLTKKLMYKGVYVDKPTAIILKGYYPYYSKEEIYDKFIDKFIDKIVNEPEFCVGKKLEYEHPSVQKVLERYQEQTAHNLVIEVNGKNHVITTDYLALMQKNNISNKRIIEEVNNVYWEK